VLDEIARLVGVKSNKHKGKEREWEQKKLWVPDDMDPVLEELPKWSLLAEVRRCLSAHSYVPPYSLMIPRLMVRTHGMIVHLGSNTVLIMASSTSTSTLISEFLTTMDADA
jgi:DNA excision repair protein ERCC-4